MSIMPTLMEQLKAAMKQKDAVARDTLRMLKTDIGRKEMELGRPLEGGEELAIVISSVKSRRDSISLYEEGGRKELAENERAQIEVLQRFLPSQLSEEEATKVITELVAELGISEKKQMGKLMNTVMERYRGQIEGKTASKIAAKLLS